MPYKDRETRLIYAKNYREAHKQKRCEERHFYDSARHANYKARKHGVAGILHTSDIKDVLHPNARCFYCGRGRNELPIIFGKREFGIDHVIPLSRGGLNVRGNIVACCHPCNASKWKGKIPYNWAREWKCCKKCGSTSRKHCAKGYCKRCYQQVFNYYRKRVQA